MIRVLLVEDHPIYRDGLRTGLRPIDDVDVVGEAATAAEAVALTERLRPDVVLLDLGLPDRSGLEAARAIAAGDDAPAILVLTMRDDDGSVFAAIRAGAAGYLLKGADQDELVRAIRGVAAGEAVFGPGVAGRVLGRAGRDQGGAPDPLGVGLTVREREILELMAAGWGNQTIARRLHVAPKTVRNQVSVLIAKLQAADRGEAIVRARAAGYGSGGADRLFDQRHQ
ncbi:response regulator [Actinoplanes sp. URMC 104]|uniref:response regulator n=1 Tax=Actinoplanes sp. URMC 104 TaxID=3423409 RepID=UPI003F1A2D3E